MIDRARRKDTCDCLTAVRRHLYIQSVTYTYCWYVVLCIPGARFRATHERLRMSQLPVEQTIPSVLSQNTAKLELPDAPASERGPVKAWQQSVEMLTYQPADPDPNPLFLEKRVYQGSSGKVYPLAVIDYVATEPEMRSWQAVHIENEYLRLMVMPEIGGRIHVGLDKRTGYDFFYRQNVIKPALVGWAGPWISVGVEFNWPQHHRPATYMPVEATIEAGPDGEVTVWCSDHDP